MVETVNFLPRLTQVLFQSTAVMFLLQYFLALFELAISYHHLSHNFLAGNLFQGNKKTYAEVKLLKFHELK
jgi:hypothetical protein